MNELTHFSENGRARMVDVSEKPDTRRVAIASGVIRMQPATLERIRAGTIGKGNVLAVADVAAVMSRHPDADPEDVRLTLISLQSPPLARLNRSLRRGRGFAAFRN